MQLYLTRAANDDNKGNIGVVQKKDSDDEKNVSEINDIKLSRTQRAINAKDERLNKQKDQKEQLFYRSIYQMNGAKNRNSFKI